VGHRGLIERRADEHCSQMSDCGREYSESARAMPFEEGLRPCVVGLNLRDNTEHLQGE
jgi:hypothetical protein